MVNVPVQKEIYFFPFIIRIDDDCYEPQLAPESSENRKNKLETSWTSNTPNLN